MVRRSVYGGDAALVALIAASSLVGIQSYSMSSLFGAKAPGLRAQNSFCQGPICKTPELVPSLRARGKHGERAVARRAWMQRAVFVCCISRADARLAADVGGRHISGLLALRGVELDSRCL